MNRLAIAALMLIVFLGAALRTYGLELPAFKNDEAFAWRVAIKPVAELLTTAAGDTTPPAHYLALKAWMYLWGASPVALRGLSVLCGVLLVVATYALAVETARWRNASIGAARFGGLVTALLAAVHGFQLEPNRTARMYGMGALLAVLSAWLLLRALRASSHRDAWWIGYGVIAALFLLTHHFGLFTLAAQGVFALWCAFAPRAKIAVDQSIARRGILLAGTVAVVLYSPWLPAAIAQTSRVSQEFWVARGSALEWGQTFVRWCIGIDWADATLIGVCIIGAAFIAAHTLGGSVLLRRGSQGPARQVGPTSRHTECACYNPAAVALLAQAALPWIAVALVSTVGDRPMLQDRYMAFSQASWLALLGVVVASLTRPEWRVALAALLVGATLIGTQQFMAALPAGPPGIVAAAERLARDYRPGGVVVVQQAPDVNCLKFYPSQQSATAVEVRATRRPWPTTAHINHVASLGSDEFLSRIEDLSADVPQLWFAGTPDKFPGGSNLPGWEWMEEETYEGHGRQAPDYVLRRYERPR